MPGCAVCRVAMTSEEENIRSSSFVRTQVRSPQKLWVRFTPIINTHDVPSEILVCVHDKPR